VEAEVSLLTPVMFVPGETNLVDLIACEINSEWYFEVGSRPDGGDALVRDEVIAVRILVRIRWDGEDWKSESGEIVASGIEVEQCLG